MEAMPKFELFLLSESITHVLRYWSFGNMRGFGWKEKLACQVEQGKYSLEFLFAYHLVSFAIHRC